MYAMMRVRFGAFSRQILTCLSWINLISFTFGLESNEYISAENVVPNTISLLIRSGLFPVRLSRRDLSIFSWTQEGDTGQERQG